jgi:hypothetical protein
LLIGFHSGCGLCSWLVFGLLAKGGVLELSKRVNGSGGLVFSLAWSHFWVTFLVEAK